jgi:Uma2 family endonuclease
MDVYAREGVRHGWLIDPIAKLLEVWRLEHEKWMRIGTRTDDAIVRAEPFDAVALELATLWAD